jgi:hypothetical protein
LRQSGKTSSLTPRYQYCIKKYGLLSREPEEILKFVESISEDYTRFLDRSKSERSISEIYLRKIRGARLSSKR